MTDAEQREEARRFFNRWNGKGKEDEDDHSYWLEIFGDILGVERPTEHLEFQKKVVVDGNTKKIDVYIPETRVIIEQKSMGIDLSKKARQSGGAELTPYEQAKRYNDNLPYDEKARWIVTSNFSEIWIYDMNVRVPENSKIVINIIDLQSKYNMLEFLIDQKQQCINEEMELSIKAGDLVGILYDALLKQYCNPESEHTLKSLNVLCVRLVFCLYAEDAGIFGHKNMFRDYLEGFSAKQTRKALIELFSVLDTKINDRDPYLNEDSPELAAFPYVNGGLFTDNDIEIPSFTDEIRNILLAKASQEFDWSMISPTIFGAVFESTLNQETRRKGGMHYTSIENIHKVIDPLFLDELKAEFEEIKLIAVERNKKTKLEAFQNKLASLKWLDPAAGSGNFLTETYICIRRLENEVIRELHGNQIVFGETINPIKVSISQFYGIEINDFAVTVAKTALWIAESQMMKETEDIVHMNLDFLPLKTNANIVEGNALRMDWESVVPKEKLNYIMGNPPFIGNNNQSNAQRADMLAILGGKGKTLDYVAGWYFKAASYINGTKIRITFVSTNSITQGEQVAGIWKPLHEEYGVHIDFAYRTFRWDSEANIKAHVHCVIVGFSTGTVVTTKKIFDSDRMHFAENINAYLMDAPNVFIESRKHPLCAVPEIRKGNQPTDGGNLIIEGPDIDDFLKREPNARPYIKKLIGSKEYINRKPRYCLWLVGISPAELRKMPLVMERVQKVREMRLKSPDAGTRRLADTPTVFREINNPESFIVVPSVSSERRRYVPMGFMNKDTIATNLVLIIPNASLYHFGILTSNVHMAWMRAVCGRLKSDYRYSKDIVYNNFPWPTPTEEQKAKIEQTAQAILDARELFPDSSLADLYDPLTMPPELQKAHAENDRAVMQAYGFSVRDMSESDCVAALMKMYQAIVEK